MTERIRPGGAGTVAHSWAFLRSTSSPRAGLLVAADRAVPADWPTAPSGGADVPVRHLAGWTCEIRSDSLVLLNPLGEGALRSPLPHISAEWAEEVRFSASAALFWLPFVPESAEPTGAIAGAASSGEAVAATVRTAFSDDYGISKPVGRNAPCPCGSGKKYKHCCGK